MTEPTDRLAVRRAAQMFPILGPEELDRASAFGEALSFATGDALIVAGQPARGLYLVRSGRVRVTRRDGLGATAILAEHGPGAFVAEVGQDRKSVV